MSDLESLTSELREAVPGVLEEFEKEYKPPRMQRRLQDWRCFRCGACVVSREDHLEWHRELSLRAFTVAACLKQFLSKG